MRKKKDNRLFHVADSSVLLNMFIPDNEKLRIKTREYLDHYGRLYRSAISVITLGEITTKILAVPDSLARKETLKVMEEFLSDTKTGILKINKHDLILALELADIDYNIDVPELVSLSAAIRNNANVFMVSEIALFDSRIKSHVKDEYSIAIQKIL